MSAWNSEEQDEPSILTRRAERGRRIATLLTRLFGVLSVSGPMGRVSAMAFKALAVVHFVEWYAEQVVEQLRRKARSGSGCKLVGLCVHNIVRSYGG